MDAGSKRQKEKAIVEQMIRLYCRGNHHTKELCAECVSLLSYANARVDHCPFMETKTFCSNCKVHCYKPDMREQIRKVMRYAGPRMLFHHPVMAIRHVVESQIEKKQWEESNEN